MYLTFPKTNFVPYVFLKFVPNCYYNIREFSFCTSSFIFGLIFFGAWTMFNLRSTLIWAHILDNVQSGVEISSWGSENNILIDRFAIKWRFFTMTWLICPSKAQCVSRFMPAFSAHRGTPSPWKMLAISQSNIEKVFWVSPIVPKGLEVNKLVTCS